MNVLLISVPILSFTVPTVDCLIFWVLNRETNGGNERIGGGLKQKMEEIVEIGD